MYTGDPRRPMYTGGLHVYRRSRGGYMYTGAASALCVPCSAFCVLRSAFCVLRSGDLENVPALRRLDYDGIACYADYYVDMSHNFV
jgi:hypothetical protein